MVQLAEFSVIVFDAVSVYIEKNEHVSLDLNGAAFNKLHDVTQL